MRRVPPASCPPLIVKTVTLPLLSGLTSPGSGRFSLAVGANRQVAADRSAAAIRVGAGGTCRYRCRIEQEQTKEQVKMDKIFSSRRLLATACGLSAAATPISNAASPAPAIGAVGAAALAATRSSARAVGGGAGVLLRQGHAAALPLILIRRPRPRRTRSDHRPPRAVRWFLLARMPGPPARGRQGREDDVQEDPDRQPGRDRLPGHQDGAKMGIATVAIYSDADRNALHVRMADEAVHIGPSPAAQSYIVIDKVMEAVRATGAEAVHPGYGFLQREHEVRRRRWRRRAWPSSARRRRRSRRWATRSPRRSSRWRPGSRPCRATWG